MSNNNPSTLIKTKFDPSKKYRPPFGFKLPERKWPNNPLNKTPIWCSVDLRDGNQALVNPMGISQKLKYFNLLVELGFKEIEVGFPSASDIEFSFMRELVKQNLLQNDIIPQVLTQSREHLIRRTFESLEGIDKAIVHLYNSTSEQQRRIVFNLDKEGVKKIAVDGTKLIKELAKNSKTEVIFEYSPESFTLTETDYALEVCNAVIDAWQPTPDKKMIINLPSTVEVTSPNIYADQIEWISTNLHQRDSVILSIHPHNDRGCAVASAELALMAGGDRIEGTLFGNGERTGNVDLITLAMNLFSHGIDPKLNFSNLPAVQKIYEECTGMYVHDRHPYAGSLVFTAFSGSHQDAINKGMTLMKKNPEGFWDVPYIPIDPQDLGRSYEAIVRINSQSGKGGIAFIMEQEFGCILPKAMHPEFGSAVQKRSDAEGRELLPHEIWKIFSQEYLELEAPLRLKDCNFKRISLDSDKLECSLNVIINGELKNIVAEGNGPVDSCKAALNSIEGLPKFNVLYYLEHALTAGADSKAIAYIQVGSTTNGDKYGVGIDNDITMASIKALLSAVNRL